MAMTGGGAAQQAQPATPPPAPSSHVVVLDHDSPLLGDPLRDLFTTGVIKTQKQIAAEAKAAADAKAQADAAAKAQADAAAKAAAEANQRHNQLATLDVGAQYYDISKWQGDVDFQGLAQAGVKQIVIKVTDGTEIADRGEEYWHAAVAAGITPTGYVYLEPGADPAATGKVFADTVERYDAETNNPHKSTGMLDVEEPGLTAAAIGATAQAMAAELEAPVSSLTVYSGAWFWNPQIGSGIGADVNVINSNYDYQPGQPVTPDLNLAGMPENNAIQFTSTHSDPHIPQNTVDVNVVVKKFHD
ncbi:MAG: hypothetical protein IPJ65_18290 [Archangiaceae bacterium]|nr:hypothetical protein [Archangiaceae bacterium]